MKKLLSILCGIALVMGFMVSSASSQTVKVEFSAAVAPGTPDGVVDPSIALDSSLCGAQTVNLNIYATNWNTAHSADFLFGVKANITITDPAEITVNSYAIAGGPWELPPLSDFVDNGGGSYTIEVASFACSVAPVGGQFLIGTMNIQCNTPNVNTTVPITTSALMVPDGNAISVATGGILGNCSGVAPEDGAAGALAVILGPPPCENTINPQTTSVQSDPLLNVTGPTFSVSTSGVCSPTTISYSDDCVNADVNTVTGVLTVYPSAAIENCQVTATDLTNTGACALGDCVADVEILNYVLCEIEIYIGGAPVPPLNTYNKPGRRGIALTCNDTVQFSDCTDCDAANPGQFTPCPEYTMVVTSGTAPVGTSITTDGLLTIGACDLGMVAPATIAVTVTDPCNGGVFDTVEVVVGEVIISVDDVRAQPGSQGVSVDVSLDNLDHAVKAISTDIRDMGDYLSCTGCTADPDRALAYTCIAMEQTDGDCRVVLYSTNPAALIAQGTGAVLTVEYDVAAGAPSDGCVTIVPTDSNLADRFGDPLCPCEVSGDVCFILCGDVYPRECLPNPNCGDGVVDIFDILEEVDFVLGIIDPSACQLTRADVPTGTPPYCSDPDSVIDIFDVLVIIDMALGKANCCDYYYFGLIY